MHAARLTMRVRRSTLVPLLVGSILVLGLAAAQVVAIRGTVGEPARGCQGTESLRVVFGDPETIDGRTGIPLFVENHGSTTVRAFLDHWEVDSYRVRWDGRLSSLGTQEGDINYFAEYKGDDVAPGARLDLGVVQLSDVEGKLFVVGFADQACGSGVLRA